MSASLPITRSTRRITLSATPAQTVFSFAGLGPVFDIEDLKVYRKVAPATTFTQITSGFTKALTGTSPAGSTGATATFAVAPRPLVGDPAVEIRLVARRTHERATDVARAGRIHTQSLELELDKLTVIQQELRRDVDEALIGQIPDGSIGDDLLATMPAGTVKSNLEAGTASPANNTLAALAAAMAAALAPVVAPLVNLRHGIFRPQDFGTVWLADDRDVVWACLSAARTHALANGGAEVVFEGLHNIGSAMLLNAVPGLKIHGQHSEAGVNCIGSGDFSALYVAGAGAGANPTVAITANRARGARTIAVADASTWAAGEFVAISQPTGYGSDAREQIARLTATDNGTDLLTLQRPLEFAIDTALSPTIQKISLTEGVEVCGLIGSGEDATGDVIPISVLNLYNPLVEAIRTRHADAGDSGGFLAYQCLGGTFRSIHDYRSGGNPGLDALKLWRISHATIEDIVSEEAAGFGLGLTRLAGNRMSNISANRSAGRAAKWDSCCGNLVTNHDTAGCAATFTGLALSGGSSDNRFVNPRGLDHGGIGCWTNGTDNSRNVFVGYDFKGNTTFDLAVAETAPLVDVDNVFLAGELGSLGASIDPDTRTELSFARKTYLEAKPSGAVTVATATQVDPVYDTVLQNVNAAYVGATSTFTAREAGLHGVAIRCQFSLGLTTAVANVYLYVNGSLAGAGEYNLTFVGDNFVILQTVAWLKVGDVVTARVRQNSGSDRSTQVTDKQSHFKIWKL
jgi:hypothetical protein